MVDITFTYLLLDRMGSIGEANLIIKWLFELNLLPIWACMAVLASFLCGAILGSGSTLLNGKARRMSAALFSVAISVRVGTNLYMAAVYFDFDQSLGLLLPIALIVFFLTLRTLNKTGFDNAEHEVISMKTLHREGSTWKIVKTVAALVLIPLATLGFLQVLTVISGVENLPRWLRSFGLVTELQGRFLIVGLIAVVVMIAAMIYAVITLFELLGRRDEVPQIERNPAL